MKSASPPTQQVNVGAIGVESVFPFLGGYKSSPYALILLDSEWGGSSVFKLIEL